MINEAKHSRVKIMSTNQYLANQYGNSRVLLITLALIIIVIALTALNLKEIFSPEKHAESKIKDTSETIEYQASQKTAADSAPFAILTPEMWQVKIMQLLDQNEAQEAIVELKKLRENYPDFEIDKTLLERLQQHEQ